MRTECYQKKEVTHPELGGEKDAASLLRSDGRRDY